jgi:hypothetical protein
MISRREFLNLATKVSALTAATVLMPREAGNQSENMKRIISGGSHE